MVRPQRQQQFEDLQHACPIIFPALKQLSEETTTECKMATHLATMFRLNNEIPLNPRLHTVGHSSRSQQWVQDFMTVTCFCFDLGFHLLFQPRQLQLQAVAEVCYSMAPDDQVAVGKVCLGLVVGNLALFGVFCSMLHVASGPRAPCTLSLKAS